MESRAAYEVGVSEKVSPRRGLWEGGWRVCWLKRGDFRQSALRELRVLSRNCLQARPLDLFFLA